MKKIILLLGVVGIWWLYACQSIIGQPNETHQQPDKDVCIAPPVTYNIYANPEKYLGQNETLPLTPWMVEETVMPEYSASASGGHRIALVHHRGKYDEIWLRSCSRKEDKPPLCNYHIFRTDTNTLQVATQPIEHLGIEHLFLAKDGTVWGITVFSADGLSNLSRYNEQQQTFEPVQDADRLFSGYLRVDAYEVDQNGILWLVNGKYLYRFNPETFKAEKFSVGIEDTEQNLTDLTIASDELIYISLSARKDLIRFSPQTARVIDRIEIELPLNQIPPIWGPGTPQNLYFVNSSFMDHNNHLWIHNYGWMEPDGTWQALIERFPGFFGKREIEGSGDYYDWLQPDILLESSDGRLWFRSPNGMTWFDFEKGEWCWFTTYQSNILEDQEHNLWMIADNKLYRYELEP